MLYKHLKDTASRFVRDVAKFILNCTSLYYRARYFSYSTCWYAKMIFFFDYAVFWLKLRWNSKFTSFRVMYLYGRVL